MGGLMRRTHNVHKFDHLVLSEEECDAALGPLRGIMAHMEDAIQFGAGTAEQIKDRFAAILEPGLTDYIVLQIPGRRHDARRSQAARWTSSAAR